MYKYTDRIITHIDRQLIHKFAALKSMASYDEMNVIGEVNTVYADIDGMIRRAFLILARTTYEKHVKDNKQTIDEYWLDRLLDSYDATTKYVYSNEFDRKRGRLIEAVISSDTKSKEIDGALRSMSFMVHVYAIRVTDEAVLQAYRDDEVELIEWDAEEDEKTCAVCAKRDGKIYEIEALPAKPHMNCRCEFWAVDDDSKRRKKKKTSR
jgi:SPP1 gp7 family putative phage head morphogenesis protein